jgi:hypothetical protein
MKPVLPLFVFIDACGWEILKGSSFGSTWAPHRKCLESVFGYSSACVPSILSGRWPVQHRNWSYFVYDPKNSPFKWLAPLRWLPRALTSRRRFRRWLSRAIKARMNFRGYFDLYNIPFEHISLFDFTEKRSPLRPLGMNRGPNIVDFLQEQGIAHHVSDPARSESENLETLIAELKTGRMDFAFAYLPELDGLLHRVGNQSPEIPRKLEAYDMWIERLLEAALEHYKEVRLYVFSDHGMANCEQHLDLMADIESLPLRMGRDYAAVYDSTMARFWFFNPEAERLISDALARVPQGRILSDEELEQMHCLFPDRYFGELIFLVREGVLIVPSHIGQRPIRAMHGYHPRDKHSYAALLSNLPIPATIQAIPDIFHLMTRDAMLAKEANGRRPSDQALSVRESRQPLELSAGDQRASLR